MLINILTVIFSSVAGAIISSVMACIPGLHVYNLLGMIVLGFHTVGFFNQIIPEEALVSFMIGMIVGYSMLNTIPSVLLAAPDESAFFMVQPGQKYLLSGCGYEAVMITTAGSLAGLLIIVFIVGPLAPRLLPLARIVFQKHTHWVLWCVICFMLMSEWPKNDLPGKNAGWKRFFNSCKSTGMGLVTFLLSGFFGFILFFCSPVSVSMSFQNLMPGFVGLFTIPWLITNLVSNVKMPIQQKYSSAIIKRNIIFKGVFSGGAGGLFAAFFPVITGGVGGFLAGHATALRNDKMFLVSQGTSKLVYYVGGVLLFFVPGLHMTRGGGAWLVRGVFMPDAYHHYYMALASIAIAGALSFFMVDPLTRMVLFFIERCGYRYISGISLAIIISIVVSMTGMAGMLVMFVGTGIGLIPVLFGSRRMNCLGIILLPMACNMSGFGPIIAHLLGLF